MTVQGFLWGIAAFIALAVLQPGTDDLASFKLKMWATAGVGILVAIAASMH